jgi:hypothetical protein
MPTSGRSLALVWLCAAALAAGSMIGLVTLTPDPQDPAVRKGDRPGGPPFGVFVGSSLTRQAFPPEYPANEIVTTARAGEFIVRVARSNQTDDESIDRVRWALDAGVKLLLVEVDPLLRSFRSDEISAPLRAIRDLSDQLRAAALEGMRALPGGVRDRNVRDMMQLDGVYDGNDRAALNYRPYAHAPRDPAAIAELMALARQQGAGIVWIAMPRSQTASEILGPAFETSFAMQLREFSAKFGALWRPAVSWPNAFFVDRAHLNAAGRARFIAELRHYVAAAR